MEERVALIGIIVENSPSVTRLNEMLSQYGEYIIGRMGVPFQQKGMNIISVALCAPQTVTSALSGKIGALEGISAKTIYAGSKK